MAIKVGMHKFFTINDPHSLKQMLRSNGSDYIHIDDLTNVMLAT